MTMQSGFLSTVSLRMPKEKALESSQENLDIVFSSVIKPNINLPHPQAVREIKMKISGVALEKLKEFPWDGSSQKVLQTDPDYLLIRTSSDIFLEEESLFLPIQEESLQDSLAPTPFCQSDDPGIIAVAKEIVGAERNAWRAAKKIAEWVDQEITPNYNVGFASAAEILKNREGDCTEHTVIFVALCRAAGIPARAAVGVMYGSGIFAYHMWPEVFVGRWVDLDAKWLARDEKTGEYYTDATHIKFGRSDLNENLFQEMITSISEIMGKLQVEILEYKDR
jgi:transglutaminase-like putative cysteine protease